MDSQAPHKLLIELQEELKKTNFSDPATKEKMMNIVALIDKSVANQPIEKAHRNELVRSLRESLFHLEVSHPAITATVNNIIYTLNNMGI